MRLALLATLAACGSAGTAGTTTPRTQPLSLPASGPAGLYWIPYMTCPTCDRPKALAAYVVDDIAEARAITSRLEGSLSLGLPFVIHADEIGLARAGIVVVVGAYPRRADAEAATRAAPAIGQRRAEVVEVGDEASGETPHHVVRIDRGARVPAWSRADVAEIEDAANESEDPATHATEASRRRWIAERLAARKPACTVEPGDLFVAERAEIRWYTYAPVRCGDAPAYVPWTASLLGHAAVVRDGTGYRLYQVVGAQCDRPIIESWRYDERGRQIERAPSESTLVAGC